MNVMQIAERRISLDQPTYFIADIAANHDGDLKRAKKLIHLAAEAGADAAKFQNFKAPKIVSDFGFKQLGGQMSHQNKWKKSVYQVYEDASLNDDWSSILKAECDKAGIDYSTSPYDIASVDHAAQLVAFFKIGSGDITWPAICRHIASKGKPIILACGASTLEDIDRALTALSEANSVALLQCNTNYTGAQENFTHVNLRTLNLFAQKYPGLTLGLSDHTAGHATVLGAVALGARIIEKHFTDDNGREGPDHAFSMTPSAWREMVDRTRELEAALGDGIKRVEKNEETTVILQRRCLRAARSLSAGGLITDVDIEALRPAPPDGLEPWRLEEIIGKQLKKNLEAGEHLTWAHIA